MQEINLTQTEFAGASDSNPIVTQEIKRRFKP